MKRRMKKRNLRRLRIRRRRRKMKKRNLRRQ